MLTTHPLLVPEWIMGRAIPLPPSVPCLTCNGTVRLRWRGGSRYKLPGPGSLEGGPRTHYFLMFCLCRQHHYMETVQIDPFRTCPSHSATDSRSFRFSEDAQPFRPCWRTKIIFSPAPEHSLGDAATDRTDEYTTPIYFSPTTGKSEQF